MKDSVVVLCVICNGAEARKHGPECRACYKKNKQRSYRQYEDKVDDRMQFVSLEVAMNEVDRLAYRDWLHLQ